MRTVAYSEVLQLVSELAGITYTTLPTELALRLRGHISRRFRLAWEADYWPELMRVEERLYRGAWAAGTTYTAGTEVFYRGNTRAVNSYYQALRSLPLTVSSLTRVSTAATATTSAAHGLTTGDLVTITGAAETEYNVTATVTVLSTTQFYYTILGTPTTPATGTIRCTPNPVNDSGTLNLGNWYPCQGSYTGNDWATSTTYAIGDVVRYGATGRYYVCITANTGALPTSSSFAVLTPFDKYIAYEQTGQTALGEVRDLYSTQPTVNRRFNVPNWTLSSNGVQVPDGPASVWVEYRTRFVPLTGSDWVNGTLYAVGDQVLYNSSGSIKNFYTCLQTTAVVAPSNTAYWAMVEIPYVFQPYLVMGAYADYLRMDGQMDKAIAQERLADEYLAGELQKLHTSQPQYQRLEIVRAY